MVLKDNVAIQTPQKKVWDFLTGPDQVGQCVPGVEKIGRIEPVKKYQRVVSTGLSAIKGFFNDGVHVLGLDELHCARLKAHGTITSSSDLLIEAFS